MKLRNGKILSSQNISKVVNKVVNKVKKVFSKEKTPEKENKGEILVEYLSSDEILEKLDSLSLKDVKESEDKDFKNPIKIGEGTFGSAWHISPQKVKKITNLYEQDEDGDNLMDFSAENIVEGIFLRSFKTSFIGHASKVEVLEDKICLTEKYSGKKFERTCDSDFKNLPHIMTQMARILMWMEKHNIIHMDIKPGNLCLENNKLSLIDWGFVSMLDRTNGSCFHGTEIFSDPSYLTGNKMPDFPYDMFGMGMCIDYFLKDSYLPSTKWNQWKNVGYLPLSQRNERIYSLIDIKYSERIFKVKVKNGEKYFEIFKKMIDSNEETRIKPSELYYHPDLTEYRELYPLEDSESFMTPYKALNYRKQSFVRADMKSIWKFIEEHEKPELTKNIITKYLKVISKKKDELKTVAISAIYLTKCLTGHSISLSKASKISEIPIKNIHDCILDILYKLEWNLYPNNS